MTDRINFEADTWHVARTAREKGALAARDAPGSLV